MSKPDWEDAPNFAMWLAQDWNGRWYWYECKPRSYTIRWSRGKAFMLACDRFAGQVNKNWKNTLERRP